MTPSTRALLSSVCFFAGFASILIWFFFKADDRAHAERFGIFVGLWAPTFLILSDRLLAKVSGLTK